MKFKVVIKKIKNPYAYNQYQAFLDGSNVCGEGVTVKQAIADLNCKILETDKSSILNLEVQQIMGNLEIEFEDKK